MRNRKKYRANYKYRFKKNVYTDKTNTNFLYENYLSIIAIIISVAALSWTIYQDFKKDQEKMIINSFIPTDSYNIKFNHTNLPTSPGELVLPVKVLLTNSSAKPLTLLDYSLEQNSSNLNINNKLRYPSDYLGMNKGFIDENKEPLEFPIVLNEGESKLIILKIGLLIDNKIFQEMDQYYFEKKSIHLAKSTNLVYSNFLEMLSDSKINLYGFKTDTIIPEDLHYIEIDTKKDSFPRFLIKFKTVNNKLFSHHLNYY